MKYTTNTSALMDFGLCALHANMPRYLQLLVIISANVRTLYSKSVPLLTEIREYS